MVLIPELHHQAVIQTLLHSTSDPWPHPDTSLSSPPPSPPPVQELLELDQLVIMLLQEEHQHISPLGVHRDLFWNSCTEMCTPRWLGTDWWRDERSANLFIRHTIRESCLNRARFISDSCVSYVILTRYVRRIHYIKVIHLWYRRERSAKHTWTYVERSWKAKNLRMHLAKIAHKCGRFTEDLRKNCV